ncbi:MAG: DUF5916 domain-containing protein, partial [Ginsengibacter sp.]
AFDKEPQKILSNNLLRDKYNNDDGISFIIDSYNDKSNAILFFTNSLGARFDEEVIGNDGNFNSSFNTFWDVSSNRDEEGYTLEYRIPFTSLRFKTNEKVVMSFRVVRQIARKNEYIIYPRSDDNLPNMIWRVSTGKEIEFSNLKAKKPVYFIPYVNLNYAESNTYVAATNAYKKQTEILHRNYFIKQKTGDKFLSSLGADLKIGLSKNFTLDVSVNTDFAHAEVDNRIVNFTRFNVLLPEKRIFFLESANFLSYSFPNGERVFNSRNIGLNNGRIVPIVAGARLIGKSNGWQIGALNMQTQGIADVNINPENFSVFRFRKELYKNGSFFGGIFTNRISTHKKLFSNQVIGLDFYRKINDHWAYGGNIAASKDAGLKPSLSQNVIYNAFVLKDVDRGFSHYISFTSSGKNFNPAIGFTYDNGYKEFYIINSYGFFLKKTRGINSIGFLVDNDFKYRNISSNYFESSFFGFETRVRYKNGFAIFHKIAFSRDSISSPWNFSKQIFIPVKKYRWITNWLHIESPNTKGFNYLLNSNYGTFYGGKKFEFSPEMSWSINKHFNVVLKYSYFNILFPDEYSAGNVHYINNLLISGIVYSYSATFSARTLFQYDNISRTLGGNIRVRYNPKEGTDLYIVYTPLYNTDLLRLDPHLPQINNQSFIIKYTKTFNLSK